MIRRTASTLALALLVAGTSARALPAPYRAPEPVLRTLGHRGDFARRGGRLSRLGERREIECKQCS